MKRIKLTQNKYALVDDEDFEKLNDFKWYALKRGKTFYAVRRAGVIGKIHMHRVIINTPKRKETDHIDRNGLNNQRNNLRICTHAENQRNKSIMSNNTSGYKGLSWCERNKKWLVRISLNNKRIYIGHFKTKVLASKAYNKACLKYHGKFANI